MTNPTHNRDLVYERETAFFDQDESKSRGSLEFLYAGYGLTLAREQLYRYAGDFEGKQVLEIGCGNGDDSLHMVSQGAAVIGIELSRRRVAQANRLLARHMASDRAIAIAMSAERLGFADNSFDIVTGIAILHHLDLGQALQEVRRTLKPGGVGIFLEARGGNPFINLYRRLTPSQRTSDEHPLVETDFSLLKSCFEQADIVGFYFTALASFLLRRIWKNEAVFIISNRFLTGLDQRLIRLFPFLDRFCWIAVIRVKKIE